MAAGQAAQASRAVQAHGSGGNGAGGGVAHRAVAQAGDDARAEAAFQRRQGVREPGLPLWCLWSHPHTFPLTRLLILCRSVTIATTVSEHLFEKRARRTLRTRVGQVLQGPRSGWATPQRDY